MNRNRLNRKLYSLISIIVSGLSLIIIIKINYDIAHRYLESDGKTQALFGLIEIANFYYKYYLISLALISLMLAIIGSKKSENKLINRIAYLIAFLTLIAIFLKIWIIMI